MSGLEEGLPMLLIANFKNVLTQNKKAWNRVIYPKRKTKYLRVILIIYFLVISFLLIKISNVIPFLTLNIPFIHRSINFNKFILIILMILWFIFIYKGFKFYFGYKNGNKTWIGKNLAYMIGTLKLYDEEYYETVIEGKEVQEKRIVRVIRVYYKETQDYLYVRVMRDGDRFTEDAINLADNLEATLGKELDSTNFTINFAEYVFLQQKDKRINLSSTASQKENSDRIKITGNISYELHKVPHSLIVGGTGSGKSFFILGKIISYLNLSPQADLRIIDPKKADLSLLRFVSGFEDKVATEAHQICKMLREVVELMEKRYTDYFNDVSAFGKTYKDFNLPIVIIIFDEFSAFMHSVDKKLAKEALDYVFTLVMKGRQAGCIIEILMQRPSADDLPTNIRAQMGFKAGLGAMDSIGYNMIFDTNDIEYKTITKKGGGYIQIDGIHLNPVYFETPYINENFDFISEIEKLMKPKH